MTDNRQGEDPTMVSFGRNLLVGGLLGLGVGASWEGMAWFWAAGQFTPLRLLVLGAALGLIGGFVTWVAQAGRERPRRHAKDGPRQASVEPTFTGMDPIGPGKHPGQPPAAFEQRLAAFLHCTTEELLQPRPRPQSKMPFWSIADFGSYVGPKPVWIIRRILERIRATVRRSRCQR